MKEGPPIARCDIVFRFLRLCSLLFPTDEQNRAVPALARLHMNEHSGRSQCLLFENVENVVAQSELLSGGTRPTYVVINPIPRRQRLPSRD
jgi:hypothetical protein